MEELPLAIEASLYNAGNKKLFVAWKSFTPCTHTNPVPLLLIKGLVSYSFATPWVVECHVRRKVRLLKQCPVETSVVDASKQLRLHLFVQSRVDEVLLPPTAWEWQNPVVPRANEHHRGGPIGVYDIGDVTYFLYIPQSVQRGINLPLEK